jgi:bifunctional UDP-N-acetylglucosamine pyrophosphorylase/glucosamine-1-phosphate N-acetyltransferase
MNVHMPKKINVVILAAGKGTRMCSDLPKVLHKLAGKPLLAHVIDAARQLSPEKIIVVYGYGGKQVVNNFKGQNDLIWVEQAEQLGTGHALQQTIKALDDDADTIVMLGDVPLISVAACKQLIQNTTALGLMTVIKQDPANYGRIVRNENKQVTSIVEFKDADTKQREIKEVNTGIMVIHNQNLKKWLGQLSNNNAQGEYYLTDVIAMAVHDGYQINAEIVTDEISVEGVNNKVDLAKLERQFQLRLAQTLMNHGVTIVDPARLDVRGELKAGRDVEIDVGCIFEGKVTLADNVKIGAYSIIKDSQIGAGTQIYPNCQISDSTIGEQCHIGPFARIRPNTKLDAEVHIGNFVELKNTHVKKGSKANHLSYLGDADIGAEVNIGAGTITCNYDGANKYRTVIEDGAFIGSDTQLVAPVTIGQNATIAAGSTITKDAPANQLTVCRAKQQMSISGWKKPVKKAKE